VLVGVAKRANENATMEARGRRRNVGFIVKELGGRFRIPSGMCQKVSGRFFTNSKHAIDMSSKNLVLA
jgi:hypothetical protein